MRLKITVVSLVLGLAGYAGLTFVGLVSPLPGMPRDNAEFGTLTWTETYYASSAAFRSITVHTDGRFTEHFPDGAAPDRHGTLTREQLDTVRELATGRRLAAERRRHAYLTGYDCTDSSTYTVAMGDFAFSAVSCGDFEGRGFPAFAALHAFFDNLASPVGPPGGA